ncbi:MAG: ABC transporter ATP-binding protein [Burkholderiaceae bacterium]|nr:ABC transporter ATP-binding protein [Burkholderiaceae bacterium]HMQ74025.1 ABC transporter ATP-binding protein [Rubrivivax sp.]
MSNAGAGDILLEASELHAWYGSSHVLQGVSLAIRRGQTLGLLGRNGMGKTTLIRTLMGLMADRRGRIVVAGRDVSRARPYQVAHCGVGYVPEGRGVFPNLTVHENLVMAARAGVDGSQRWPLERVLQTFPRLAERMQNLGSQLSGGEQQMLAIGRALMTNPSLMILDEATEGLAPQIVAEIWRVIASIRADGIAVLIVDRDHRRVAANAERLLVLQKGQAVLEGAAAELRDTPELLQYLGL